MHETRPDPSSLANDCSRAQCMKKDLTPVASCLVPSSEHAANVRAAPSTARAKKDGCVASAGIRSEMFNGLPSLIRVYRGYTSLTPCVSTSSQALLIRVSVILRASQTRNY